MKTSQPNSSEVSAPYLRDRLLTLLWRQWAALGVPAADPGDDPFVVDPEALLLITTSQGRYDARLFDAALDWLWERGASVNLQRLGNLQKSHQLGDERVLAAIAAWLGQRAIHAPWRKLAGRIAKPESDEETESLFRQRDGSTQPSAGPADEVFLRFGLRRGPVKIRGLGLPPNPRDPRALLFKLRSLFGIQARCEVVLWLLTHAGGNAAEISRATAYFPGTVERCLRELAESGLVRATQSGRSTRYWVEPGDWDFLRGGSHDDEFPKWCDWPRLFAVAERTIAVLEKRITGVLLASELRRGFDDLQPVIAESDFLSSFTVTPAHTREEFTATFLSDLDRLLA